MASSNHLEALTAELLGDVGQVHDEIKALRNDSIPALVDSIKTALEKPGAEMAEAADNLSNISRETLQAHVQASNAARRELDAQAKAAAANAQAAINTAVAGLVPSVKEAVADAARGKIKEIKFAENMANVWFIGFLFGLVFLAGWLGGSRVFASVQSDHSTWAGFWRATQWGIGTGLLAPVLILIGLGLSDSRPATGWTLLGAGGGLVLFLFAKLIGI